MSIIFLPPSRPPSTPPVAQVFTHTTTIPTFPAHYMLDGEGYAFNSDLQMDRSCSLVNF